MSTVDRSAAPSIDDESVSANPIDPSVPSIARCYDAVLGGKDNYRVDRLVRDQLLAVAPELGKQAWDNRNFLIRTTRFLAEHVDQFLDCGSGLPTMENTHQAAQRVNPNARVVYVDNDPIVLAHGRALLAENDRTHVIMADFTNPPDVLFANPFLSQYLDLDRPLALCHIGTLHHLSDDQRPHELIHAYLDALPAGSYLALSHFYNPAEEDPELGELAARLERAFLTSDMGTGRFRTWAEIAGYFDGLELVEPGLVNLADWRPSAPRSTPLDPVQRLMIGAVARKP